MKKENGVPVLAYELRIRRPAQKHCNRRESTTSLSSKQSLGVDVMDDDNDDEFTDELVARLKRDYACIKIQACCRAFITKQRHLRLLELLGKLKTGKSN